MNNRRKEVAYIVQMEINGGFTYRYKKEQGY